MSASTQTNYVESIERMASGFCRSTKVRGFGRGLRELRGWARKHWYPGRIKISRAHPRNSRNPRLNPLFMSKSCSSNQIPESSLTAQSVKSGIHRKTIQQPRAPLRVGPFEGGECLILIIESCKNRRNRRLRDVLSARQFLQFRKYVSSIRLFDH